MKWTFVLLSLPILLTAKMVSSCSSRGRKDQIVVDGGASLYPSILDSTIINNKSSNMVSRSIMKSEYKQVGGTCLLASYAFLLEYAGVF